jgi:polysaccharide transporter, PST family
MESESPTPQLSRRNTARWVAVTGGAQIVRFVTTLLSTAILARLLEPKDFGLIAAAAPVLAFTAMLQNLGINEALIQRSDLHKGHINALFVVLMGMGLAVSAVLFFLAPLIAAGLAEPRLTSIIQAMAGLGLGVAAATTPLSLLNRQLKFKQLALIDVASVVAGLIVGVIVALLTRSYWSLVLMQGATIAVQLAGSALLARWTPGRALFDGEFRKMIGLGTGFSTFNLLNFLSRNADILMIARMHGTTAVGHYERAYKMMLAPLWQSVTPFGRVLTPVLARLQGDPAAYRQRYFEAVTMLMAGVQPAILAALVFPAAAVEVVLGAGWQPATPIFFWLCLTGLHQIQTLTLGWLFVSQGRAKEFALLGAMGAAIIVTAFFIGLPFGPAGVAMAYAIVDIGMRAPLTWWLAGRRGPVSLSTLVGNALPHAIALAATAAVLLMLARAILLDAWTTMISAASLSYIIYTAVLLGFPKKRRLATSLALGAVQRLMPRHS